MAEHVLTNCKVYIDGSDFTGQHNQVELRYMADLLDNTTFGDTARSRKAGLVSVEAALQAFYEADSDNNAIDDVVFANLGVANKIITLAPTGGAVGEKAFTFKSVTGDYKQGASIGDLLMLNIVASGDDLLIKGTVGATGSKTTTANGDGQELGAVSASQYLYGIMHVYSVSGTNPTLDVIVESDAGDTWTGAETTRLTFTQKTAVGSQWLTPVAGAITDTWWRVGWTIGGTDTPTFGMVVIIGIQ